MGVGWRTSASSVLLITERSDHDWVGHGSYIHQQLYPRYSRTDVIEAISQTSVANSWCIYTGAGSIQWLHVENINAIHLSEDFQTLKTGGLLEIGWNGANWGSWWTKVGLGLDLCLSSALILWPSHLIVVMRLNGAWSGDDIPLKFFIGPAGTSYLPSVPKLANALPSSSHYIPNIRGASSPNIRDRTRSGAPVCPRFRSASLGNSSPPRWYSRLATTAEKLRLIAGLTAARRAAATVRWRNILDVIEGLEVAVLAVWQVV